MKNVPKTKMVDRRAVFGSPFTSTPLPYFPDPDLLRGFFLKSCKLRIENVKRKLSCSYCMRRADLIVSELNSGSSGHGPNAASSWSFCVVFLSKTLYS